MFHRPKGKTMYFRERFSTQWQKIFFRLKKLRVHNYCSELRYIFSAIKNEFWKRSTCKVRLVNLMKKVSKYGKFQDLQVQDNNIDYFSFVHLLNYKYPDS